MMRNNLFFASLFFIFLLGNECPNEFIAIDKTCYYKKHIDVLQDFIEINESLRDLKPQHIGSSKWEGGKLIYLYLGDHLLTSIPDSIGLLSKLSHLDLRENQIICPCLLISNFFYIQHIYYQILT